MDNPVVDSEGREVPGGKVSKCGLLEARRFLGFVALLGVTGGGGMVSRVVLGNIGALGSWTSVSATGLAFVVGGEGFCLLLGGGDLIRMYQY